MTETLARQVTEKAEGNPLFAEEIISFLSERGLIRTTAAKSRRGSVGGGPAFERPEPADRAGGPTDAKGSRASTSRLGNWRRFDPPLPGVAVGEADIDTRLAAMQALDLVRRESTSGDYSFKHALVRDALYQSLLSEARTALHLKIAEEIERRSGNRLTEVAEVLAHHYRQTERTGKAFAYLSMAGSKSLAVYSLDEADNYFSTAIALLDKNPDCASDEQVAELLVDYTFCSNASARLKSTTEIVERFRSRLDRLGDNRKCVLVQHHYIVALLWSGRYRQAEKAQINLSAMAADTSRTRGHGLMRSSVTSWCRQRLRRNQSRYLKRLVAKRS